MKAKTKNIIFIIIFLLIIITLMILNIFTGGISLNPDGTVGNTAGNLNNSGLFCENDGKVYFSNSFDHGVIYVMDADESNLRRLNSMQARNILAGGSYLYYFQLGSSGDAGIGNIVSSKSFIRMNTNGKQTTGIIRETVVSAQLVDNYLYLLIAGDKTPELHKIKIDGSESEVLADYEINPVSVENGIIYYNGTRMDHYLYGLNTSNGSTSVIWRGNLWYPCVEGSYVYYLDVENNYRLCRYNMDQDIIEVLTDDRVDCFNVGNSYIYYQKNSETEPQLKCMRTDGSNVYIIAEGNYTNINMTSQYVYFQTYGDDISTFHAPLGGTDYSIFTAASTSALENQNK